MARTPRNPDPDRPPMVSIQFRLETVHLERLQHSGNFQVPPMYGEGARSTRWFYHRDASYNTLAKVIRAALTYFLALDEPDQECPRQMRRRKYYVKTDPAHPESGVDKRFLVQIPREQHRALKLIQAAGGWPSLAEIILYALDMWLPTEFIFGDEQAWMQAHDPTYDQYYERPRPYPPEGTFRTVEEHNAWRDATHPRPRPKRRIYKKRKKEETP